MVEEDFEPETDALMESNEQMETSIPTEKFDVIYSCLRCGTNVPNSELSRLPEIKCICGFRVFTKVRPPIVKSIKAV
jgi:DNA-directed RNA polymerase subunit P